MLAPPTRSTPDQDSHHSSVVTPLPPRKPAFGTAEPGVLRESATAQRQVAHHPNSAWMTARPGVSGCDSRSVENAPSTAAPTEQLNAHGRRRLFFVGDHYGSPGVQERFRGFTHALSSADASAAGAAIRVEFRERSGAEVAAQILGDAKGPDALDCANDELALSTMKALQRAGAKVPDDIANLGWDDIMAARYVSPGLTTVRQPHFELGRIAATGLHERILGAPTAPGPRILPTELVLRSSCGCPETDDRDVPWVTS